jgi:predicted regulator of Ras-like GTPase activity (Roadblock/LC7/MglB family)
MRIHSLSSDGEGEIRRLLTYVSKEAGVQGSVIVGHDGVIFDHDLPKQFDAPDIALIALDMFRNTRESGRQAGHDKLHQLICRTMTGYVVIADFGGGLLVTLSRLTQTKNLISLMRSITQLVAS